MGVPDRKASVQDWVLVSLSTVAAFAVSTVVAAAGNDTIIDQGATIQEIIVTARKFDESIDKVPVSITALSQQTMDDLHIENVSDLATIVPGLFVSPGAATAQDSKDIAIRGISNNGQNGPTTQLYIDETPIAIRQLTTAPSFTPQPYIFDLDRVEVLRGPQGTLFGSSAMGGAIRFITPQPNLHDASGFAKLDVGYTQSGGPSYEVGAAYGSPIVTGVAGFRVSAWYQSLGGFIDQVNPFTGEIVKSNANTSDAYVIRPAFTWAPSDELTITPSAFIQHHYSPFPNNYWVSGWPNPPNNGHNWGGASQPLTDDLRVGSLAIKYDVGGVTLQSDTSYLDRHSQATSDYAQYWQYIFGGNNFIPGLESFTSTITNTSFTHAWMQEFRVSSQDPTSRITWVGGVFYRRAVQGLEQAATDLEPLFNALGSSTVDFLELPNYIHNGQALSAYEDWRATDISEAAFVDVTVNITSKLKAAAGVRYEHTVTERQEQFTAGPLNGTTGAYVVLPDAVGNPVTPEFSLTYQYTDTAMVYARAASGYRPGGGNQSYGPSCDESLHLIGLSAIPPSYKSDSLWTYELGAKSLSFNRRLAIEGSLFYTKWSDIQSGIALPSCGYQAFTGNQGKAISQGFDLQVAAVVTEGLKLHALVGYTDIYYPNAAYSLGGSVINFAGDKLPSQPWSAAVNVDYSRDISSIWGGSRSYVRLDDRWLGPPSPQDPNLPNYDALAASHLNQAYNTLNVRFGVIHGGLDLSLYLDNSTNSDPLLGYSHSLGADPLYRGNAIRPRTGGLTVWYHY